MTKHDQYCEFIDEEVNRLLKSEIINYKSILFIDKNNISGLLGFVKTFEKEYENIRCKYVYVEEDIQIENEKERGWR